MNARTRVHTDRAPWDDFVHEQGLERVPIQNYYSTGSDIVALASNILSDLVSMKAIKLPDGYAVDDFIFSLGSQRVLALTEKESGEALLTTTATPLCANARMGTHHLREFVDSILWGFWQLEYERRQQGQELWPHASYRA